MMMIPCVFNLYMNLSYIINKHVDLYTANHTGSIWDMYCTIIILYNNHDKIVIIIITIIIMKNIVIRTIILIYTRIYIYTYIDHYDVELLGSV